MDFFRRRAQSLEPTPSPNPIINEPIPEPKPKPKPEFKPEPKPEYKPEPKPESKPEPKPEPTQEPPKAALDAKPAPPAAPANYEPLEPFMGIKVRRFASFRRAQKGDYLDIASKPHLLKILHKQGDKLVLFADKVLKFTTTGKMKSRIMIITILAIYMIDPETFILRRRIALAVVEKLYLSKLCDNFLAIIIPTEYDILIANSRKTEIVTVLLDASKTVSNFHLNVFFKNKFEYNPAAELGKKVIFEEVEGAIKTRILRKTDGD